VQQQRLQREGFRLEVTRAGKHYWRKPEIGRRLSPPRAAELLRQKEVRMLGEAGWGPVEVEGERYWRRPSSGRLYPRGGAYDLPLLSTVEEKEHEAMTARRRRLSQARL
jgi:hypothetical protein